VSDHFHPWIDAQGNSPFVWSVLGGIAHATDRMRFGTGVTCPSGRVHPAILAQAAATAQCMFDGRFWFGVGSGEALNEHVLGTKWPEARVRLAMLEEAIGVIRRLWSGEQESHYGRYFTVENARLYTLPETAPPIIVSAFGPASLEVATRCGDGLVSTKPDPSLTADYTKGGGKGPKLAQLKVAWADSERQGEDLAYRLWPTSGLAGELSQVLPTPAHFEQAVSPLHREDIVSSFPCGPDPQVHLDAIAEYRDAGYDELYITQIGPDQEGFLRFYEREILPEVEGATVRSGVS
jgi:G6PDH family F420-dependent oxidoreductase